MLPLACIMQWLFLFRSCVPPHFVFFLLLFFVSAHTHTGPGLGLLTEYRQVVAIARKLLESYSIRSSEYALLREWLSEIRDRADDSEFPYSAVLRNKQKGSAFDLVLHARNDSTYDWLAMDVEEVHYVTEMLAKFKTWKLRTHSSALP